MLQSARHAWLPIIPSEALVAAKNLLQLRAGAYVDTQSAGCSEGMHVPGHGCRQTTRGNNLQRLTLLAFNNPPVLTPSGAA